MLLLSPPTPSPRSNTSAADISPKALKQIRHQKDAANNNSLTSSVSASLVSPDYLKTLIQEAVVETLEQVTTRQKVSTGFKFIIEEDLPIHSPQSKQPVLKKKKRKTSNSSTSSRKSNYSSSDDESIKNDPILQVLSLKAKDYKKQIEELK